MRKLVSASLAGGLVLLTAVALISCGDDGGGSGGSHSKCEPCSLDEDEADACLDSCIDKCSTDECEATCDDQCNGCGKALGCRGCSEDCSDDEIMRCASNDEENYTSCSDGLY